MISFLYATIIASIPLLFATLGELITEKAGHLNLGVEGMMLLGAMAGFMAGISTGNPLLAVIASMIAGGIGALIYGILTISLKANQVVSGLALTIFGTGVSSFVGSQFVGQKLPESIINVFKPFEIPLISKIPVIGPILFNQDLFIYSAYIVTFLLSIYLFKTRLGQNLSAIGENPAAADASGINVTLYKYVHVILGGALCGLGGAYLSIVEVPTWQDNITAGRGWIAVALVIFATWKPGRAFLGAILFGGLSILGFRLQQFNISQNLLDMLPYLVTIVVLVISSMRKTKENKPPKALSDPYFRENR